MENKKVAPFTGAWIEIYKGVPMTTCFTLVAPFTGAWIEMMVLNCIRVVAIMSHPSRVRGLKCPVRPASAFAAAGRTLHGCVD